LVVISLITQEVSANRYSKPLRFLAIAVAIKIAKQSAK